MACAHGAVGQENEFFLCKALTEQCLVQVKPSASIKMRAYPPSSAPRPLGPPHDGGCVSGSYSMSHRLAEELLYRLTRPGPDHAVAKKGSFSEVIGEAWRS